MLSLFLVTLVAGEQLELLHEWAHVDYDWSAIPLSRDEAIKSGVYNANHVTVTGVKSWKNDLYVTSPRWLAGVPASLNKIVKVGGKDVLQPYPDWSSQTIGDPSSLQYIQSMEIDRRGWMWIIDVGRINILEKDVEKKAGLPKLWVWDIDGNKLIHEYVFPDRIASHTSSFLNDIFVDDVKDIAFISDTSGAGGLIVYDFKRNRARRWDGHASLAHETPLPPFNVEGLNINKLGPLPVDGLAYAPTVDRLYYTAIHGLRLHSVAASTLANFMASKEMIDATHVDHGEKTGQCDGLTVSDKGNLYMTMLTSDSVQKWPVAINGNIKSATTAAQDSRMKWPDTFGWADDQKGGLLVSAARLENLFLQDGKDVVWASDIPNVRIFRLITAEKSYQHSLGAVTPAKTHTEL